MRVRVRVVVTLRNHVALRNVIYCYFLFFTFYFLFYFLFYFFILFFLLLFYFIFFIIIFYFLFLPIEVDPSETDTEHVKRFLGQQE